MNFTISSSEPFSQLARTSGIETWQELLGFVKSLPYGRNSQRQDFSLIFSEKRGSCSSKHALLKTIAEEHAKAEISLILGIYKMTAENTPGIGNEFLLHGLKYIPEAHCYLSINGQRVDVTHSNSSDFHLEKDLLEETVILPYQVIDFKTNYHQAFLKNWLHQRNYEITYQELWRLRERCIKNLSQAK